MNRKLIDNNNIKLFDVVALTEDVPEYNLKRGSVGLVVEILSDGEVYQVEFSKCYGQMSKCPSFLASQLRVLPHEQLKAALKLQRDKQAKEVPVKGKNAAAQQLIKAMEKPPHLTDEDIEALNQSIKEGKIPIRFDSPFDLDEDEEK